MIAKSEVIRMISSLCLMLPNAYKEVLSNVSTSFKICESRSPCALYCLCCVGDCGVSCHGVHVSSQSRWLVAVAVEASALNIWLRPPHSSTTTAGDIHHRRRTPAGFTNY
jgi:hypothetical protein